MNQYYGYLNGNEEYTFKQSSFGGVRHILVDATEFLECLTSGMLEQHMKVSELRVDTWCGRNYKYGPYSNIRKDNGGVRNACEYCFVEYDPEDKVEQRRERARTKERRQVSSSDLPF